VNTSGAPAAGTLDREVELLKRALNYAVAMQKLAASPIASVPLLKKKNVRKVVLDEAAFTRRLTAADEWLRPILILAFDTGMRKEEILSLRWKGQTDAYGLDLKARTIALADDDTKTDEPRTIPSPLGS
jgi:integrase